MSRSLKYDSNFFFDHRHIYIYIYIYIWTPRSITLPRSRCACGVITSAAEYNYSTHNSFHHKSFRNWVKRCCYSILWLIHYEIGDAVFSRWNVYNSWLLHTLMNFLVAVASGFLIKCFSIHLDEYKYLTVVDSFSKN